MFYFAAQLAPDVGYIRNEWAGATLVYEIARRVPRQKLTREQAERLDFAELVRQASPSPRNDWERRFLPVAQGELMRIRNNTMKRYLSHGAGASPVATSTGQQETSPCTMRG